MLARTSYPQDHVDTCRARVAHQVAAYRAVAETASPEALRDFEAVFFNTMVLALDTYFTHRGRGQEGKDGNALNEVRLLCGSMTEHGDVMTLDKTIKWNAAASVLGYKAGDTIKLTEADFVRIMTEPENALTKQYAALVAADGASLEFTEDGIAEIARIAATVNSRMENIGARRLHTVMTTQLEETLFDLPDVAEKKIVVNAAVVREKLKAIVEDEDLRKYIL